jgi:radical SAM-linked protein
MDTTTPIRQRVRLRYRKQGDLRLISHRDLARTVERWFRRAELKLSLTEGFHPRPRMTFLAPLAVGIAGEDEVMELELAEQPTAAELLARLTDRQPPGLVLVSVEMLPVGARKAQPQRAEYTVRLPAGRRAETAAAAERLLLSERWIVPREEGRVPVDIRAFVEDVELDPPGRREAADDADHPAGGDVQLRFRLRITGQGTARPREVLSALGLADLETQGVQVVRTRVEIDG